MMAQRSLFLGSILGLAAVAAACSSSGGGSGTTTTSSHTGGSGTTSTTGTTTTGTTTTGTTTTTTTSAAHVRVVHASPNAPAVDFCYHGSASTTFTGPVLGGLGVSAGLAYSQVTEYLPLPADTYTVRLVSPGQTSCATSLGGLPDVTGLTVTAGQSYSVAALGELSPPADAGAQAFEVKAFADDSTVPSGMAKVRFIHASPDTPAVDVGTGSGSSFTAVWSDVAFGTVGQVSGADYLVTPPLTNATLSARAHGATTDALVLTGVSVPAGAIVSTFAIGNLGGSPKPLKVLVCVDTAQPSGGLAQCTALP